MLMVVVAFAAVKPVVSCCYAPCGMAVPARSRIAPGGGAQFVGGFPGGQGFA